MFLKIRTKIHSSQKHVRSVRRLTEKRFGLTYNVLDLWTYRQGSLFTPLNFFRVFKMRIIIPAYWSFSLLNFTLNL